MYLACLEVLPDVVQVNQPVLPLVNRYIRCYKHGEEGCIQQDPNVAKLLIMEEECINTVTEEASCAVTGFTFPAHLLPFHGPLGGA